MSSQLPFCATRTFCAKPGVGLCPKTPAPEWGYESTKILLGQTGSGSRLTAWPRNSLNLRLNLWSQSHSVSFPLSNDSNRLLITTRQFWNGLSKKQSAFLNLLGGVLSLPYFC